MADKTTPSTPQLSPLSMPPMPPVLPPMTPPQNPVIQPAEPYLRTAFGRTAPTVVKATAAGAIIAAITAPLDRTGVGWLLGGLAVVISVILVARRLWPDAKPRLGIRVERACWAAATLALFAVGALRASSWLFTLCVLTAGITGWLAVATGRSVRAPAFGASDEVKPTADRLAADNGSLRLVRATVATVALLVLFGTLLAFADAAFAATLSTVLPRIDGTAVVQAAILFCLAGIATFGACRVAAAPPARETPQRARSLRRIEWALPTGALVVLFGAFVTVQLTALFGGEQYVNRMAGLTSAEYARSGFWQLSIVAILTLGVIALVVRRAHRATVADRAWLRGLLGALSALTLVIVVSALTRMWAYQQAYGFTVLRLLVQACELWLGVMYLLITVAVILLRAAWLRHAIIGAGVVTLLSLAAMNPDRFIAEQNILRWEQSGQIDVSYLANLSADAAPALQRLPEPLRSCALSIVAAELNADTSNDWRAWNAGRSAAREITAGMRPSYSASCR